MGLVDHDVGECSLGQIERVDLAYGCQPLGRGHHFGDVRVAAQEERGLRLLRSGERSEEVHQLVQQSTVGRCPVGQLLAQVDGTVGVITPASAKAAVSERLAQAGLAGEDRIAIVTPVESKGLEYDGVLVVTPDEIVATSPGGVRALYVALTRPTMRLVTLDVAPGADWRKSLG